MKRGATPAFILAVIASCTAGDHAESRAVGAPPETSASLAGGEAAEMVDLLLRGTAVAPFTEIAPGFGLARVPGREAARLVSTGIDAQVLPLLRLTSDQTMPIIGVPIVQAEGLTGAGTVVGAVDSGFDVAHPALRKPDGRTRMAWLLDYSRLIRRKHPELEALYGVASCREPGANGRVDEVEPCVETPPCRAPRSCRVTLGAVYSADDIDALLAAGPSPPEPLPTDEQGHGTLVLSLAAGTALPSTPYRGVAPESALVGVKGSRGAFVISGGEVLRGVQFIFDRARAAGAPASANLSLTGTFVPHDGYDALGASVAAMARERGHVVVAAAGNTGDPSGGVHQVVRVGPGAPTRIPFKALSFGGTSDVAVLVEPHLGASLRIGCETSRGQWVTPVERGRTRSAVVGQSVANVIWNPDDYAGRLPRGTSAALVTMQGPLSGDERYFVVLEGTGTADLWIEGGGFTPAVREATVGSPALHPEIIAVGATTTRAGYRTVSGEELVLETPRFDPPGLLRTDETFPPPSGHVASFSAGGPGLGGVVKPDILAPGVLVIGAASRQRVRAKGSMWASFALCPRRADGERSRDERCTLVDDDHGAAFGTSFASPFVAGAAALLLQLDPTLDQRDVRLALQAGAHRHRAPVSFRESASVGELDLAGSIAVVRRMQRPIDATPVRARSWGTPNSGYVLADGSRPLTVLYNLNGEAETADGFDSDRFRTWLDHPSGRIEPIRSLRRAPGLWEAEFFVDETRVLSSVTIRASFDGVDVIDPITLPVALDPWQAHYPSRARAEGCTFVPTPGVGALAPLLALFGLMSVSALRRRLRQAGRCR